MACIESFEILFPDIRSTSDMPLILHIGYHKTGSTAIQNWLTDNRENLNPHGIVYPSGLSSWLGHPEMSWAFETTRYPWQDQTYSLKQVLKHYKPHLVSSLDPNITVVLSSEEFCRLEFDLAALLRLRDALAVYAPIIVGYVRSPMPFLLSRYRHEVQHGAERRTLREFLLNFDNLISASFAFRTSVWRGVFPNSCIFRSYEDEFESCGSIVKSFGTLLGLDTLQYPPGHEEKETKMHPTLLDLTRLAAQSDIPTERKEQIFEDAFALSNRLPPTSLETLLATAGLGSDVQTIVGSVADFRSKDGEDFSTIINMREAARGRRGAKTSTPKASLRSSKRKS